MSRRIADFPELTSGEVSDEDMILCLDISTGETKKVKVSSLRGVNIETGVKTQVGSITVMIAGTELTFDEAFSNTNYTIIPNGQLGGIPVSITLGTVGDGTKTASSIFLYAAADNTVVNWIAIGA